MTYRLRPRPSSHFRDLNRIARVNQVVSVIVERLSQRFHFKKEDRIGRHIHIDLVHGILGMLDELEEHQ